MAGVNLMLLLIALCFTFAVSEPLYVFNNLELRAYSEYKAILNALNGGSKKLTLLKEQSTRRKTFSFKNCADPSTEIVVPANINVTPDPISIPGNISISGNLLIKAPFGSPLKTDIVVQKEVLGHWIKVPCIDNVGSCTYDDMCAMVNVKTCPPQFINVGLPCKCPFPSGNFNIQPFGINIGSALPFKITGGVKVQISANYNSALLTCVELELDLA